MNSSDKSKAETNIERKKSKYKQIKTKLKHDRVSERDTQGFSK